MRKKAGWLDRYSYDASIEILIDLALQHAAKSGPFAEAITACLRDRNFMGLLDFDLSYDWGLDPQHLVHARQALAFFEKFEPLELPGVSKTLNAFRRFAKSEASCKDVNKRFCQYTLGTPLGYPFDSILEDARRKIACILGTAPPLSEMHFRFGPGATVNVQKKDACPRVKLGVQLTCSNELAPYAKLLLAELPTLVEHHGQLLQTTTSDEEEVLRYSVDVEVVPGRLQFVPKDAKKFRTITVEPGLNTLFQQGIGRAIRKRLSKAGVDLSTQERNRALAYAGSRNDHLATIDFSSASDTIATQMVAFLLPEDWYILMDVARTRTVTYNGLVIKLEKFSTMGNSYTFELESLLFYSLAWACLSHLGLSKRDLCIFGDDLIVPSRSYPLIELVFSYCGFFVNHEKSFVSGPFRESCGADYYLGFDIRPYYQKTLVSAETLFTLHNHYMRTGELAFADYIREKWIHPDLHRFGPDGYGDGHLIGPWESKPKRVKCRSVSSSGKSKIQKFPHTALGWEGSFFTAFRRSSRHETRPHSGDAALPAYSIYVRGTPDDLPIVAATSQSITPKELWADPKHFVVPGSEGYEEVSIYTLSRGIFLR